MDGLCVDFLTSHGFRIFSEESGFSDPPGEPNEFVIVLDPVDGSTNASRSLPMYAISAGLLSDGQLVGGYVSDLTSGASYWSVQDHGAYFNESKLEIHADARPLDKSIIALNGFPKKHLGWGQYRALGSASLELCMVASGQLDAFIDCSRSGLAPWDYLGALAVLNETGCIVEALDVDDLAPDVEPFGPRRRLIAARNATLLQDLRVAWQGSLE